MATSASHTPISRVPADLEPLIQEERTKCTSLGIQLNIPLSVLQDLEKRSKVKKPIRQCFLEMWQQWFKDKGERKWIEIFEALKQQRHNRLKNILEKKYKADTTVQPDFNFEGELKEMISKWYQFGCALGVSTIDMNIIKEDEGGSEVYMISMLEEWKENHEDSYTWETLQKALRVIGNNKLAANLEEHRLQDKPVGDSGDRKLPLQEPSTVKQSEPDSSAEKTKTRKRKRGQEEEDQLLTSDDLLDVLEQLTTLNRSKFWNLGLELGLKNSTLDELKYTSTKDEFWRNVIQAWLNQEDNVKPSWRSLIDALESEIVSGRPIAQRIRDWLNSSTQ